LTDFIALSMLSRAVIVAIIGQIDALLE